MCTSQNSHSSLVKTHRSQCIQSSCFLAVLTLLFLSKLPFSLQLLHTHTPPKVTCTWLQHLDSHPENHLGPWLQTQRKERAGPTPTQKQTVGNAHRHPVIYAKQCSGEHTSRSLWAQSPVEALGDEETNMRAHTCTPPNHHMCTRARTQTPKPSHLQTPAQVPSQASTPSPSPTFQEEVGRTGV